MREDRSHRQKLMQRELNERAAELTDEELAELLLTYSVPRGRVEPIARALIAAFGSADAMLAADKNELLAVPGVTRETAALLKLIDGIRTSRPHEAQEPAPAEKTDTETDEIPVLTSVKQAAQFCASVISGREGECVLLVLLGADSRVISSFIAAVGSGESVALPTELICANAALPGVKGAVIAHNHPSGSPRPSAEDIAATRRLARRLEKEGVRLYEHFIIGEGACFALLSDAQI